MVSIELSDMSYKEKKDWLKAKYPKPKEIILKDQWGNYDYACLVHGWCVKEDWQACEDLHRCWHGKKQSEITFPSPEVVATWTTDQLIEWQRHNFPERLIDFEIPGVDTIFCKVWGWCIKEQYSICPYRTHCPEYYANKPKWKERVSNPTAGC